MFFIFNAQVLGPTEALEMWLLNAVNYPIRVKSFPRPYFSCFGFWFRSPFLAIWLGSSSVLFVLLLGSPFFLHPFRPHFPRSLFPASLFHSGMIYPMVALVVIPLRDALPDGGVSTGCYTRCYSMVMVSLGSYTLGEVLREVIPDVIAPWVLMLPIDVALWLWSPWEVIP